MLTVKTFTDIGKLLYLNLLKTIKFYHYGIYTSGTSLCF